MSPVTGIRETSYPFCFKNIKMRTLGTTDHSTLLQFLVRPLNSSSWEIGQGIRMRRR